MPDTTQDAKATGAHEVGNSRLIDTLRAQELAEECVLQNCDTCNYSDCDEEEWPCVYCYCLSRWKIAPDLARP